MLYFHFCSNYFLVFLWFLLWLMDYLEVFNFQIIEDFPEILVIYSTVVKEHLYMTWMLLNLLRHILWPRIWSSMVDFPCALEKDGNSPIVGGVSIRSNWGLCCSKSLLFLLIFISICSTSYWQRGFKISDYSYGFVYFSLKF